MSQTSEDHEEERYVIKMRGLPWSTTVDEIIKFFSDCNIKDGKLGVHMTMSREGRPSGEAYVEMETDDDIELACKKDRDHMGHRYIEVFKAKKSEMDWVVKRSGLNLENVLDDACVRLRGLPFGCSKEEIAQFFSGLEIVPNGISIPTDYKGRSTGEAFVRFISKEVADKALLKHKEKIGHRYIEIFRSCLGEVRSAIGPKMRSLIPGGFNPRPTPYDRNEHFPGNNRFNMNRGSRNFKNFGDFNDGPNWNMTNSWGPGGPGPRGRGLPMSMNNNSGFPNRRMGGPSNNWSLNGSNGGTGHCIHMRGLPFRATVTDINNFFRPIIPLNIRLLYDTNGRASGEADVEFATHEEALKSMNKDKGHMQHRYIELFLNSTPNNNGPNFNNFPVNDGNYGLGPGNSGFQRGYSNNMGGMGFGNQMGGNNYNSF